MSNFTVEPHSFTMKIGAYQYCSKCGLISFKNELSQWAIRMGCNHKEHPSYKSKLGLTNPFS